MRSRIAMLAAALVLATAAVAAAQASVESGTIVRIDPQSSVVVLDDGRTYRVTPTTVFVVENRPTAFTALRPGQRVVIQAGEAVVLREGQYVAVTPSTVAAQRPAPAAPITAVPAGVRQTIHGTVTDVDSDGSVEVKTDRDSFEVRVAPEALRQIKKGDTVIIDMTITPLGAPAASPATR